MISSYLSLFIDEKFSITKLQYYFSNNCQVNNSHRRTSFDLMGLINSLPVADETQKVETSPAVRIVNLAVVH